MSKLNRHGFSLIEIMIALGMTGALGLLVSQMTTSQVRNMRSVQLGSDVEGWGTELRHALSDESVCKEGFLGKPIPAVGRTVQLSGFNPGSRAAGILKDLGAWMGAKGSGAEVSQLQLTTVAGPLMELGSGTSLKREYLLRLDATLRKEITGTQVGQAAFSYHFRALVDSASGIRGCSRGGSLEESCSGSGGVVTQVICPAGGCTGSRGTSGGITLQGATVTQCVAASPSDCSKLGLTYDTNTKRCLLSKPPTPCDPKTEVAVGMQLKCPVGGDCYLALKCQPLPWSSRAWQCPAGGFARGWDASIGKQICATYPSLSVDQDCYGEWQVDCGTAKKTYQILTPASGGGAACPYADGQVKRVTSSECPTCQWLAQRPITCQPKCGGVRVMQCVDAVDAQCDASLCGPKPPDVACDDPSCPPVNCHFCDSRPECGSGTGDCMPSANGALFCRCRIQADGTQICGTYSAGPKVQCP